MGKLMYCQRCDATVYAYREVVPGERSRAVVGVWVCGVCGCVLASYHAIPSASHRRRTAGPLQSPPYFFPQGTPAKTEL